MKKILLLFMMCALLPRVAGAQTPTDDTFTVSDLTLVSDNLYTFDVSLSGTRIYSGYNLSISIPPTMSFARSGKGKLRVAMIKTIVNCKSSNCKLYDLSGRRVETPTRGLYIKGTRKVIVK